MAIAKKVAPEKTKFWTPILTSVASVKSAADQALAKGDFSIMVDYLHVGSFGDGYSALSKNLDNELLGITGNKTDADLEAVMKPILT